jgi:hypothetical protein
MEKALARRLKTPVDPAQQRIDIAHGVFLSSTDPGAKARPARRADPL